MNKSIIMGVTVFIAFILGAFYLSSNDSGEYDELAKCLSNKGVKMYGAYWCSACEKQKSMFGDSKKLLPYVECSIRGSPNDMNEVCQGEGIKSYPTWRFGDGSELTGAVNLDMLATKTGCPLH